MAEPRARVFEFSSAASLLRLGPRLPAPLAPFPSASKFEVAYDGTSVATARDATIDVPEAWSPEHLVLAGLLDCSLTSLRYHARLVGVEVTAAEGAASGTVTRRDEDGRFAFVDVEARLDVRLDPTPQDRDALLQLAERDCFVGASLTAKPRYVWNVE